jgi:hypothetical protein
MLYNAELTGTSSKVERVDFADVRAWVQRISPYLFNQVNWEDVRAGKGVSIEATPYTFKIEPIRKKKVVAAPIETPETPETPENPKPLGSVNPEQTDKK